MTNTALAKERQTFNILYKILQYGTTLVLAVNELHDAMLPCIILDAYH